MIKIVWIFLIVLGLTGCSIANRLSGKYVGAGVENLYREFGEPLEIKELEDGNKMYIYKKETFVRETVITTGRYTPDPRISPSFIKVETYRFTVDKEGIVTKTDYEKQVK